MGQTIASHQRTCPVNHFSEWSEGPCWGVWSAIVGDGQGEQGGRSRRGRPRRLQEEARSQRVVTFVTEAELEDLEQIAQREE